MQTCTRCSKELEKTRVKATKPFICISCKDNRTRERSRARTIPAFWKTIRTTNQPIFLCECGRRYIKTRGHDQITCIFCINEKEKNSIK